eukprot:COSAG02_NODE_220_length_28426_cov_28.546863_25_plen_162_part_00
MHDLTFTLLASWAHRAVYAQGVRPHSPPPRTLSDGTTIHQPELPSQLDCAHSADGAAGSPHQRLIRARAPHTSLARARAHRQQLAPAPTSAPSRAQLRPATDNRQSSRLRNASRRQLLPNTGRAGHQGASPAQPWQLSRFGAGWHSERPRGGISSSNSSCV